MLAIFAKWINFEEIEFRPFTVSFLFPSLLIFIFFLLKKKEIDKKKVNVSRYKRDERILEEK